MKLIFIALIAGGALALTLVFASYSTITSLAVTAINDGNNPEPMVPMNKILSGGPPRMEFHQSINQNSCPWSRLTS